MLSQTNFEAIPPKHVGGNAYLAEADPSNQILGFCRNSFFSHGSYGSDFEIFWNPSEGTFPKMYRFNSPPPPPTNGFQVMAKSK